MTLSFRERDRRRTEVPPTPRTIDDGPELSLSERFVHRASGLFATRQSRRSFLAKTAVVGSALAVNPWGYILRPGTAYGALCGTCNDGWTAFCCTINEGKNACPDGSFVAGWWKADNAAFCCGKARYIIDCNASCPTQCACRCSGADCDGRRTCCNQFRYGQCHQEIACFGPVVCRVATCTPPWQYDASCTTSSATDNNTVTHGAPCLTAECGTPIAELYAELGGANGVLGVVSSNEKPTTDKTGRYALYAKGSIFQRTGKTPFEVHGPIGTLYAKLQYQRSALKYPTSNQEAVGDTLKGVFNRFEGGVIYSSSKTSTHEVLGTIRTMHSHLGGVRGVVFGYPTSGTLRDLGVGKAADVGRHQHFQRGSIWERTGKGSFWLNGVIRSRYLALGAVGSPLGWPTSNHTALTGGAVTHFEHGAIYTKGAGTFDIGGPIYDRYVSLGETASPLGFPQSLVVPQGSLSVCQFERGRLTYAPATGQVTQSNEPAPPVSPTPTTTTTTTPLP